MFDFLKKLFATPGAGAPAQAPLPPPRFGLDELSRRMGISQSELQNLPIAYHTFTIPKRTGGVRTITAPADPLKRIQRRILRRLLARLHAHPCATGFERGHSIVTHAQTHVGQEVLVKLDIKDFFPTTPAQRVENYFRHVGWDAQAAALITRLCTHEGKLPQGAPTSPRLSNLLNYRLDARLLAVAQKRGVRYSRYADDITFSGPALLNAPNSPATRITTLIHAAKGILSAEGYTLHTDKKLRIARRHHRQLVTGLVVNQKVNLPRETRRRLRAIEHHLATGKPATLSEKQLAGWRALRHMITTQSQ